ncbi:MAG: SIS domain-containing protein [Erysipelotrichaceae bacterium]|nr:SIS domain-containing protein [Erysipelotrichaceae bacterium]
MNQDIRAIINKTWDIEAKQIERLKETIDQDVLEKIIDRIGKCQGRIIITGCGTSAMAARKIAHSLSVIDIPSVFLNPSDAVHGSLGVVQKDDIVIFISKGGNTDELTAFIDNVRNKKAFIITVSENEESILARKCDLFLKVKVEKEADEYDMLATASTLCVIAVFDAICIALMKYTGFSREKFLLNHPKGAVGERLKRQ